MQRLTRVATAGAVALPVLLGGAGLASANPSETISTQPQDRGSIQQTTGSEHEWNHIDGPGTWDHGWKHHGGSNNHGADNDGDENSGLLGNLLG